MAEIAKIESGRVGVNNASAAVVPVVNYPSITPEIALLGQAKFQGTVAEKLSRMSSILFNEGQQLSQRAGLQFAAENPMTVDQLIAMSKGDMSTVSLGSPMNVFDSAVRKIRAFELSAHAEAEAIPKLEEIQTKAQMGELDFDQVRDQIKAVTDGYGSALAEVDPESAFKYRATLATVGNKVIEETAKNETKKRLMGNGIKVERLYQSFLKLAEQTYDGQPQPDPTTGEVISKDDQVDAFARNFLANASALVGVNKAKEFEDKVIKYLPDLKINAIAKYITDEFGKDEQAFMKLNRGDAGRLTDIYQTLDISGKSKVMQTLFTMIGTQNNAKKEMDEENKTGRELKAIDLYKKIESSSGMQRKAYIKEMADLRVISFNELKTLSSGEGGESSPMAMFSAIDGIYNGTITKSEQIKALPVKAGDKIKLLEKLHSQTKSEDRELDTRLRRIAGIPEGLVSLDPKGAEFERLRKFQADAQVLKAEATRKGEFISNGQILEKIEKQVEANRNSSKAISARKSLESYEAKAGGPINSQTLSAFEEKLKAGKIKGANYDRDVAKIRNLVKQAEGNE